AIVVLRDGHSVTEDELNRLCLDKIARFKRPKRYRFVSALPKNSTGKVLKTALRELANAPDNDNAHDWHWTATWTAATQTAI
ncbi:MAG: hypothetical protein KGP14_13750, partial [Betaproteobacteria bacterium]|nr:hypothetical protein [Betaproteobacteria bacterium]